MKNKDPFFAFSYGSTDAAKCFAFYASNGKICADYRDREGKTHGYTDKSMPDGFWDKLIAFSEEHGLFAWKAPKFFKRFVLNIDSGVLNVEALFPDGRKLAANSMNGNPDNFEEAAKALRSIFAEYE